MNNNKTVSIIIPCRNEKKYISKCIDSFLKQSYPRELIQIVVADGMSNDGTRDILQDYCDKYSNVKLIDNKGLSAPKGMNLGIKSSNSDIIIIFGAHAYAHEDFVSNNVKYLENEEIGCAGGPIETINDSDLGRAISLAMSSPFGVGNALFRYAQKETYVDTVAFGAYRKEVLDKIGYFDEELVRNQDDELNYRVIKNGYKIILSPSIKSTYYGRGSYSKLWKQYYQYGFWKVRVMQKHGKPASIRHLVPAAFVLTNVFGLILGLLFKPILYLWVCEIAAYALMNILFSFKLSSKSLKIIGLLIPVFPILHLSYGLGFINGLFAFYVFKSNKLKEKNSRMSR
jgi:cellulose synthase/poly-beta-1,6-N-acetylglucosamine synthase-like glycosyltransferase